jgi:hypothetical protein
MRIYTNLTQRTLFVHGVRVLEKLHCVRRRAEAMGNFRLPSRNLYSSDSDVLHTTLHFSDPTSGFVCSSTTLEAAWNSALRKQTECWWVDTSVQCCLDLLSGDGRNNVEKVLAHVRLGI